MTLTLLATTTLFASGCVPAQVEGTFVSGHLGNYYDCPEQGYSLGDDSANRGAPAEFAGDVAACAEGEDCGTPILNCDPAQATVRLTNIGTEPVDRLIVQKIELLDDNGHVRAELPIGDTTEIDAGASFDGVVLPNEELDLRIDFDGPVDINEFIKDAEGAYIRIIFDSDKHPAVIIDSDELYRLPSVVT